MPEEETPGERVVWSDVRLVLDFQRWYTLPVILSDALWMHRLEGYMGIDGPSCHRCTGGAPPAQMMIPIA